jgi:hypothetical protein
MNPLLPQAAVDTVNVQDMHAVPGKNMARPFSMMTHVRKNTYSNTCSSQDALELRQCCLSRTQHGSYANDNSSASHSETHDADYRDARARAPDGTPSSTPMDSAPDVPQEEFYWYNSVTEMQPQNGIRSFQSEFSNNKFARYMSAEGSAMSNPTVLQDVHLAFIRLCKR